MRKFLTIWVVLCSALGWAGTCGNGYSYSRTITTTHLLIANTDQTNYPWKIIGTYADWRTVGNSGKIQHTAANTPGVTSPADFIICDAASSGNPVKFFFKYYDATVGKYVIWMQQVTASHTTDAVYYVFFGNASVSTSQQDTSLLTDAGYILSNDFSDGTTLSVTDFTGTQTMTNHSATASNGPLDGSALFTSASSQYVTAGTPVNTGSSFSLESIQLINSNPGCGVFYDTTNMISVTGVDFFWGQPGCPGGTALFFIACGSGCGSLTGKYTGTVPNSAHQWFYAGGTMTSTGAANMHIYFNGTEPATTTSGNGGGLGTSATNLNIGRSSNAANYFDGKISTMRVSTVAHSADWHTTNYNTWIGGTSTHKVSNPTPQFAVSQNYAWGNGVSPSAVMPFNVTSGNMLVAVVLDAQSTKKCNDGTAVPTDSHTSSWTKRQGIDSGTSAGTCIFTAPITSSGSDTISYASGQPAQIEVYEIQGTNLAYDTGTTTSVTASTITSPTMTVAQNNSIMICASQINSSSTYYTGAFTPASQEWQWGVYNISGLNSTSAIGITYGYVNAGSNTCGFTMGGSNATFLAAIVIGGANTPSVTSRRMAQIY
jgi:hypothetical protein